VCYEKEKKSEKEIKEETEKKGKVLDSHNRFCHAVIGTSPWKPDKKTYENLCETENFKDCPRLEKYLVYEDGIRTLKIKSV
jgi:hypothetical protein